MKRTVQWYSNKIAPIYCQVYSEWRGRKTNYYGENCYKSREKCDQCIKSYVSLDEMFDFYQYQFISWSSHQVSIKDSYTILYVGLALNSSKLYALY